MTVGVFLVLLSIFSVVISFVTEFFKKSTKIAEKISTNLLVAIISAIVGWGGSVIAYILLNISFTPISVCAIVLMAPVSFFSATQGYDKVSQTINQIIGLANKGV